MPAWRRATSAHTDGYRVALLVAAGVTVAGSVTAMFTGRPVRADKQAHLVRSGAAPRVGEEDREYR
jgi:hypothetical protein